MPLVDPVYTEIPLGDLVGYTGTPLEKLSWNCPTLECHWTNLFAYTGTTLETLSSNWPTMGCHLSSLHWNTTGGTVTDPHTQVHIDKQSNIHASLKWQDGGTSPIKWTGLCKFSFYLEFTALQWIPDLLLKHVSTSTSLCAYLWWFCAFGVAIQMKSVELKQLSPYQLYTSRVLHAGKLPDRMTSKADSVSTLGYHWTQFTLCYLVGLHALRSSLKAWGMRS